MYWARTFMWGIKLYAYVEMIVLFIIKDKTWGFLQLSFAPEI